MSGPPSSRRKRDLADALEAVALFPLPEVALFPGAELPLHVFEPRYRAMVRATLDGTRMLSVVQVQGSMDVEHPALATIAGVGEIIDATELPSGRFNILLRGVARVSLEELPFEPPYRRAKAKVVPSEVVPVPSSEIAALISAATSFASLVQARNKRFSLKLPRDTEAGMLADLCASQLLIDGRDRQRALETLNVADRVRLVTETISLQRMAIASDNGPMN